MPGFNGTGPQGMGPMTGGGRGLCNSWSTGRVRSGRGGGQGFGFGPGRGFGWRAEKPAYYAPYTAEPLVGNPYTSPISRGQELDFLRNQAQALKEELESIGARIGELQEKETEQ